MYVRYTDAKMTDELERRLIQDEIDSDPNRDSAGANLFVLEIVIGALLLMGIFVLAARLG